MNYPVKSIDAIKKNLLSGTSLMKAVAVAGVIGAASPAYAVGLNETPTGENVVAGSVSTFDRGTGTLGVNQTSDRVVIDWDSFNIGANAVVDFNQPGTGSVAVNRVQSAGIDPTKILGELNANGRLAILDRNGVVFRPGSSVNVAGILASTGDLDVTKFMNEGVIELSNFGNAEINNKGRITIDDYGIAAFVAPTVKNSGIITANLGRVELAATSLNTTVDLYTVDLYGDGLLEIALDPEVAATLVKNTGTIEAESGVVAMTATAAAGIVDNIINMNGVVDVSSATQEGGKIVLKGAADGGQVRVNDQLLASGATGGGEIEVSGYQVRLTDDAVLDATGGDGSITVVTDTLEIPGAATPTIDVTDGTFTFDRMTEGTVSLGDDQGGFVFSQDLVNLINAKDLVIGRNEFDANNVTEINVQNIDTTATISDVVVLNASVGADADVEFDGGFATFGSLFANATDDIVIRAGAQITTTSGDMALNADTDADEATGDSNKVEFFGGGGAVLSSAGNILFSGRGYSDPFGSTSITANGGAGTVTFSRNSTGDMSVGDDNGGFHVSSGELDNVNAAIVNFEATDGTVIAGNLDASSFATSLFGGVDVNFTGDNTFDTVAFANSGDVIQDGGSSVTANTLTGTTGGSLTLEEETNRITTLGDFAAGTDFSLVDGDGGLDVAGIVTTAGDVSIETAGGNLETQNGSSVSGTNVNLTNTSGLIRLLGNSSVSASDTATVDVSNGFVMAGTSSLTADILDITAARVTQVANSVLNVGSLSATIRAWADFLGTGNQIDTITNLETGTVPAQDGGVNLVDSTGGLNIAGNISSTGGDINVTTAGGDLNQGAGSAITSGDGTISLTSTDASVNLEGVVDATGSDGAVVLTAATDINLLAGSSIVTEDGVAPFDGSVTFNTTDGRVLQDAGATLVTGSVEATTGRGFRLEGTANEITTLGNISTGNAAGVIGRITIVETDGFTVEGALTTTGGNVDFTTSASAVNTDEIRFVTGGSIATNGGNVDITNENGRFVMVGTSSIDAGNVTIDTGAGAIFAGLSSVTADALDVDAVVINQTTNSTFNVGALSGSTISTATFAGAANDIDTLGDFETGLGINQDGGLTLNDSANGLTIAGDVSSTGGDIDVTTTGGDLTQDAGSSVTSGDGTITFTSTDASINLNGSIDATGSDGAVVLTAATDINLNAGSSIVTEDGVAPFDGSVTFNATDGRVLQDAGATLVTGSVEATTGRGFRLHGTANEIATLGNISTGNAVGRDGRIDVVDSQGGLEILGNLSTQGGSIDVATTGGDLTQDAGSSVTSQGGDIFLESTGMQPLT